MRPSPDRLRRRLLLASALPAVLGVMVLAAAIMVYDTKDYRRRLAAELETLSAVVASDCAAPLLFDHDDYAQQMLGSLSHVPQIDLAVLSDRDGRRFAAYPPGCTAEKAAALPPDVDVSTTIASDRLTLVREADNRHDRYAIRVEWRGHKLGYVPRAENRAAAQALDAGEKLEARVTRLRDDPDPWRRIEFSVHLIL